MLTFYHAPNSRSTSVKQLILELGIADQIQTVEVTIPRQDGSGARDPANPHPEGKVPYLTDDEDWIRERAAIILYLTDRFPGAGLGRAIGHPERGRYLSWLTWYQGVFEPVAILGWAKVRHPAVEASLRDYDTGAGPSGRGSGEAALSARPGLQRGRPVMRGAFCLVRRCPARDTCGEGLGRALHGPVCRAPDRRALTLTTHNRSPRRWDWMIQFNSVSPYANARGRIRKWLRETG